MKSTKSIIDNYYSENTPKLNGIAHNILSNLSRTDLADTLVTESYLYIIEKQDVLEALIQKGKLESIVVNFMNKQVKWNGTKFKKTFIEGGDLQILDNFNYEECLDEVGDEDEVLEKEFEHQRKVAHIEGQRSKLSVTDRILFDLAISGDYNTSGKLSKYIGVNRTSTYYMIKNLKKYLKDGYDGDPDS